MYLKLTGAPFDDNDMTYANHMYRLTQNYAKQECGTKVFGNLDEEEIEILLNEVRNKIYKEIKKRSLRENYNLIEYKIAKQNYRGEYLAREELKEAMLEQLKFALRSGGDLLGYQHGVDLKKGAVIEDFMRIARDLSVCEEAKAILYSGNDSLIKDYELCYELNPDDYRSDY